MTADIVNFPARPAGEPVCMRRVAAKGDIVVFCLDARVGLWAAWPIAAVDDDGVAASITSRAGKVFAIHRLKCSAEVLTFRAADHEPAGFSAIRWRTWFATFEAKAAFAVIATVKP